MWTTWLFLCLVRVKVWLSEGLTVETVMIQWGYWRVMWRWGCRLAKERSHTCFVSPRESCGTRQEWCLHLRCSSWAPHRWAYETLCCPPSWGGCGGAGVCEGCDKRASLLSIIQGGAGTHCSWMSLTGERNMGPRLHERHWVSPSAWEGGDGVKGEKLRG